MRLPATVAVMLAMQACGVAPPREAKLAEAAPTQAACFPQADARFCIPHVGRGERIFALIAQNDASGVARLATRLTEAMGEREAVATNIVEGFSKAEDEARTLHPDHDLYDVSSFFPAPVRDNLNRFKNFSGPNCFATALMASGLLKEDELLYVGLEELQLYLNHHFTEVSEPRFGDIIHYDVQGSKDHASFYVLDGLVFHKKGYRKGYGYRMTELTKVFVADPFEWKPSPFDDFQAKDDASFGEQPKRYYRRLTPEALPTTPAPSAQEAAAVAVVDHIYEQTKRSAPNWSVHEDMGTMIESAIQGLVKEFSFLKASPSFEARLAFERLRSLESQVFQSIEERLYVSPRADEQAINEQYCVAENDFLRGLLTKFHAYRHGAPANEAALETMLAAVRGMDRKHCRFTWGADW